MEKYYSVEQIAEMIDLHPKTIQRYIREGRLNAQKIGKSWRVTGHDLSTFMEGAEGTSMNDASPGLQAIIGAAGKNIKVSAVIDIPVKNHMEAAHVANWVSATVNSQSSGGEYVSMSSQFIEKESMTRIMLWGSPSFMEVVLGSLSELGE